MLNIATGVTHHDPDRSSGGYTLFAPIQGEKAYLIDMDGNVVQQWQTPRGMTNWCYLLDNGNLFVNARTDKPQGVDLTISGLMCEFDWDGNLVWSHDDPGQHHDARRLPNGGTAYLVNYPLSEAERAKVKGGVAGTEPEGGPFGEAIRETDAEGKTVWEWSLTNLGFDRFPLHPNANRWVHGHANTIVPLQGDRYLISCKVMNLIFIVDRASGEIVWHYQNDAMGGQHDAQMLPNGNILLFANGTYMADLHHSQVWEIDPNTNEIVWRYVAQPNPLSFFSPMVGGCQRLENGNTLICEGAKGCLFEVAPNGEVVWQYVSPYYNDHPMFGALNWLFRARRYAAGSPELNGRL